MLRHRGNPLYYADAAWRSRACARSAEGALKYKDKLFTKEGNFALLLFLCCGIGGSPYTPLTLRGVRVLAPARLRARYDIRINYFYKRGQFTAVPIGYLPQNNKYSALYLASKEVRFCFTCSFNLLYNNRAINSNLI